MTYPDYVSTMLICPEVLKTYTKFLEKHYGNNDSPYELGREASGLMEQGHIQIAQSLHAYKGETLFASYASEPNNAAIKGVTWRYANHGKHLTTTCVEHSSVRNAMEQLQEVFGYEVIYPSVDTRGCVEVEDPKQALRKDAVLISMIIVNNKTEAVNTIRKCARYMHASSRTLFHMDDIQALGKLEADLPYVDLATFSARKIYGLKGSTILYKRGSVELVPLISDGQQEDGLRADTSNAPTNIVFAKALRLAIEQREDVYAYAQKLNSYLCKVLSAMEDIVISPPEEGSPFILSISNLRVGSEIMLSALNTKGSAVSAQSTCLSHNKVVSVILLAMGLGEQRAAHAIHVSLLHLTTREEVGAFLQALKEINHDYRIK